MEEPKIGYRYNIVDIHSHFFPASMMEPEICKSP